MGMPAAGIYISKFRSLIRKRKFFLLAALPGFLPLLWFHPFNTLITGGDFWLPLGTTSELKILLSSWLYNVSGGQPNSIIYHVFPWISFWSLFKVLGLSLSNIEKLWFISVFLVSSLSMFFLTKEVFGDGSEGWKNLIPAVFYPYNLYIMITGVVTTTLLSYSFLPLFFLVYLRGTRSKHPLKLALALGLITVLFTSAAGNPPIYLIPFLVAFLFLVYRLVFRRSQYFSWSFNFLAAFFYLLFNSWWLFLFVRSLFSQLGLVKAVTGAAAVGSSSAFSDLFRLLGSWAFFAGYRGAPYFPFAQSYLNPVLYGLTFVIPILALFGTILNRKRFGTVGFFVLLAFLGIFLSHGSASDLPGELYNLAKGLIPFMWIYREPFAKFTSLTVLGYAILIGAFFDYLEKRVKSKLFLNLLGLVTLTVVLTVAWPLVIGDHYPDARGVLAPSRTGIPAYWFDLANWFSEKRAGGRVLVLPDNPNTNRSGIPYAWGYDSADVGPHLLAAPWVERNNGFYGLPAPADRLSKIAFSLVDGAYPFTNEFIPVLGLLNVSRVLQRNDVNLLRIDGPRQNYSPDHVREALKNLGGLSSEKSFGRLDVYRVSADKYLPKIYIPEETDCVSGNLDFFDYSLNFNTGASKAILESNQLAPELGDSLCNFSNIIPVELFSSGGSLESSLYTDNFLAGSQDRLELPSPSMGLSSTDRFFGFKSNRTGDYQMFFLSGRPLEGEPSRIAYSFYSLENGGYLLLKSGRARMGPEQTVDLGSVPLKKGFEYLVRLEYPGFEGIVDRLSFGNGAWSSSLSGGVPPKLSSDPLTGEKSMLLSPGTADAYAIFPSLDPTAAYRISFYYKVSSGTPPTFLVWRNTCSVLKPDWAIYSLEENNSCASSFSVAGVLNGGSGWNRLSYNYYPTAGSFREGVDFATLSEDGRVLPGGGDTLIKDFKLEPRAYIYTGLILRAEESPTARQTVVPKVIIDKPTRYTVRIAGGSGPKLLVFSETFSKDWKLRINSGADGRLVPESNHFLVNSFANAWLINTSGNTNLEIYYQPEIWFRLLLIISVLSMASSLVFLFRLKILAFADFFRKILFK